MEDEATDLYFGQNDVEEGIGPQRRDQYLRTLIRNTYNYHMNEIFATVQNEYIDWTMQVFFRCFSLKFFDHLRPEKLKCYKSVLGAFFSRRL